MKKLFAIIPAWLLCVSPGCAIAQQLIMPAISVTVEARVHDPDGRPVEGATVRLDLPRYGNGQVDQRSAATTNRDGVATVSGIAQQAYGVSVEKDGFYRTVSPLHDADPKIGVHKMDFELRPIRQPVHSIAKKVDRLPIPVAGTPVGFDLEHGDWVVPHGKGRAADFVFTLTGYLRSSRDYNLNLQMTFSRKHDGIMLVELPHPEGSEFKFPYEAPLDGYEPQRTWSNAHDGSGVKTNFLPQNKTGYIFRVRTELDERGNVARALHGTITGELFLGGTVETQTVSFAYQLNPDWTRNIEFSKEKSVPAGSGRLLAQP